MRVLVPTRGSLLDQDSAPEGFATAFASAKIFRVMLRESGDGASFLRRLNDAEPLALGEQSIRFISYPSFSHSFVT
jgi:hypothetical protein